MTAETTFVKALRQALPDVPVLAQVPATRPQRFVTVERTGGPRDRFLDRMTLAVQCWTSPTPQQSGRAAAAALCDRVALAVQQMPVSAPDVADSQVVSIYNFPDPDSGQDRYQITATAVVVN